MKICLISDALPGHHKLWGGSEFLCWRIGKELQGEGHEVFFFTTKFEKNTSKNIFQIPFLFDKFSKHYSFFPFFAANFPLDVYSIFYSIVLLKKTKPDIIHFFSRKLFLPVLIAALILRIPTVFTVLEYFLLCPRIIAIRPRNKTICKNPEWSDCFKCISNLNTPKKTNIKSKPLIIKKHLKIKFLARKVKFLAIKIIFIARKNTRINAIKILSFFRVQIFNYFVKKINIIIFPTRTSKDKIGAHLSNKNNKIIYLYKPTKIINKSTISPFQQPTILFVGSLYPHKGSHIIIQAMPYIISQIKNIKLLIVGDGDYRHYKIRIKNKIEKLKIKKHVELLGQKTNEDVLQIISNSKIVTVPEQWSNDFGSIILLESMFLGKPVVASRIGSNPEFIEDGVNGFLVKYNNPEQFAQKIIWLLKNKHEADLMGQKAKDSIDFLFKKDSTKEIIKIYSDIKKYS